MSNPVRYRVSLTPDARNDLAEIGRYRAGKRGLDDAERLLDAVLEAIGKLEHFPRRGPRPKELAGTGESDIHQTQHGLYRILYEVSVETVAVFLIADGRRDMQTLLSSRLLTRDPPG